MVVPEATEFVEKYKEEIAQEFGVFRSIQEMDAVSKDMTKKILDKKKEEMKSTNEKKT